MTNWSPIDSLSTRPPLRRTPEAKIAGLAGGISVMTGIDRNIIRAAFLVLALASGAGFMAYLGGWILVPSVGSEDEHERSTGALVIGGGLLGVAVLLALLTITGIKPVGLIVLGLLFCGIAILNRRPKGLDPAAVVSSYGRASVSPPVPDPFGPPPPPVGEMPIAPVAPVPAPSAPSSVGRPPTVAEPEPAWPEPVEVTADPAKIEGASSLGDPTPAPEVTETTDSTASSESTAPSESTASSESTTSADDTEVLETTDVLGTDSEDPTTELETTELSESADPTDVFETTEFVGPTKPEDPIEVLKAMEAEDLNKAQSNQPTEPDSTSWSPPRSPVGAPMPEPVPHTWPSAEERSLAAPIAPRPASEYIQRPHWAVAKMADETVLTPTGTTHYRPAGPPLAPITMAALLAVLGVALVLNTIAGVYVGAATVLGLSTAIVGLMIAVSAFIGRTLPLIPMAILLLLALPASATIDHAIQDGTGATDITVSSIDNLQSSYRLGVGELVVDLSRLEFTEDTTVTAAIGTGSLEVIVPADAVVEVRGQSQVGYVGALGAERAGLGTKLNVLPSASADESAPRLILEVEATIGSAEVYRAR